MPNSRATPFSSQAIPVITDVHGNVRALRRVLEVVADLGLTQPPLFLGDLLWSLHQDCDPLAVLRLVMTTPRLGLVRGNTDEWLVNGALEAMPATDPDHAAEKARMIAVKSRLSDGERRFLEGLPLSYAFVLNGIRCLAVHASPGGTSAGLPLGLPPAVVAERLAGEDVDCVISGHLHRSFVQTLGRVLHVSVGAVGRHPWDHDGIAEFTVLDASTDGIAVAYQRVTERA